MAASILLIDDKAELLHELEELLKTLLRPEEANVIAWLPTDSEEPKPAFDRFLIQNEVRLVVTDYDLTGGGQLGLFGPTVVGWCQSKAIPVGDFSRGHISALPEEPNLFELRVPVASNEQAANYIVAVFRGFERIRTAITSDETLIKRRSPAAALAALLGARNDENQFVQYGSRYGGANSALIALFAQTAPKDKKPSAADKSSILTYIMGHLLLNAVLRFPGPILNRSALAAYVAVNITEMERIEWLFATAGYEGPFAELGPYFWTAKVDDKLMEFSEKIPGDTQFESPGEMNRKSLEVKLNRELERAPECKRCGGKNGGFYCPFTSRTVCQRADCSVASNVWVPQGARLCRIERDFYDEWAPILGM